VSDDDRYRIRASRARPPERARAPGDRREAYGSALAQFEELLSAAEVVGPASTPLPLFYALSQAGRAIAAAHCCDPWRLRRHGLSTGDLSLPVLDVAVERAVAAAKDGSSVDSVTGVAAATAGESFEGAITIGEAWGSLPEISALLPTERAQVPLLLVPEPDPERIRARTDPGHVYAILLYQGTAEEAAAALSEHYPTTADVGVMKTAGMDTVVAHHTDYGPGYLVRWQAETPTIHGHDATWDRVAPSTSPVVEQASGLRSPQNPGSEARWLRPAVGGVALSPLLTWWTLLFGLSMLARYEPGGWVQALDLDASELAAPLRRLLRVGIERVPELVDEALAGSH
jgi:hypothetical protein